jgi:hypothetical protein
MSVLSLRVAARYLFASRYDGKFVGKDCRLQWRRDTWHLEELPQKGKRKLRVAEMQNLFGVLSARRTNKSDNLMPENILQDAKLSTGDSYESLKKKIAGAMEDAVKSVVEASPDEDMKWVGEPKWYENEVYFLEVIPEDVHPFKAEGKDFTVSVAWTDFKAYSPDSDMQLSDPHYTIIQQKSAGAARKLYNTLMTDPNALKSVPWKNFTEWLNTKKIGYDMRFSQWT